MTLSAHMLQMHDRSGSGRTPDLGPDLAAELAETKANAQAIIRVLEALAGARDVESAIAAALEGVRAAFDWRYGSYWHRDGDQLKFLTESGRVNDEFRDATISAKFARGKGLPGRVWNEQRLLYVEDVTELPGFVRADAARRAGIQTAIAFPIERSGEVIGVMDFFVVGKVSLSEARLVALADVARGVSQGIQRIDTSEREAFERVRTKVEAVLAVVDAATRGDLTVTIDMDASDEIGRVGKGLETFLVDLRERIGAIASAVRKVDEAATRSAHLSKDLGDRADRTAQRTNSVSAASGQIVASLQGVAASSAEMKSSVQEVARSAASAARTASSAVEIAKETTRRMARLEESSVEIGKVVKAITRIAHQTNMLALNATIEAARAGEAGRGFAVVAHEVKELAKETARATEEIAAKVDAIQADTQGSSEALGRIGHVISEVETLNASIAAAVEEQIATTSLIANNVAEGARGAVDISREIGDIAKDADHTTASCEEATRAAAELATLAATLESLTARFKCDRSKG